MISTLRSILILSLLSVGLPAAGQSAVQPLPTNRPTTWICRGKVVDSSNRPVVGASVWAKGTRVAATTNSAGIFQLELPVGPYFLLVDYPGHLARDTQVSPTDSAFTIPIYSTQPRSTRR